MSRQLNDRNRELARIHLGAKDLALDRGTYEGMLFTIARVRSAADLDHVGRARVLEHLAARGAKVGRVGRRVTDAKSALISKIDRMLALAARPRAYADGMARRMFKIERLDWCDPDQLRRLVAALQYDARRRAVKAARV